MKFSEIRSAVSDRVSSLRDWIGSNVVGEERDYGAGASDTRMRDYAVLGGAAGATVGGVAGTMAGFNAQAADSIREEWVQRSIEDPSLVGYSESITPDIERTCTTDYHTDSQGKTYTTETCTERTKGYWHNFSPRIDYRQVGTYTEPRFVHESFWEPLASGFVGAMVGGVTGVALGAGVAALRNHIEKDQAPKVAPPLDEARQEEVRKFAGNAVVGGAVLGAGAGAVLGTLAGNRELAAQEVHSRTWSAPVTENRYLGDIPSDHYDYIYPWHDDWSHGSSSVHREAPVLHRDGSPTMHVVGETFETNRYGPVVGGILGGMIGAGVGIASGVAVGVTSKMLAERQAAGQTPKEDAGPEAGIEAAPVVTSEDKPDAPTEA